MRNAQPEPWTKLPNDGFLRDVLAARERYKASGEADVKRFVARTLPTSLVWGEWSSEEGRSRSNARLGQVEFKNIVFGRSDVLAERYRIENVVDGLVSHANVDVFAAAVVWPVPGSSKVWVEEGNHRLVAQHLLGIVPWARIAN